MRIRILTPNLKDNTLKEETYNNVGYIEFNNEKEYNIDLFDEDENFIKAIKSEDVLYMSELVIIKKPIKK